MKPLFIGREQEKAVLQEALDSRQAELIAVIGRRRVGKTYLIKQFYAERLVFRMTGELNSSRQEHLQNFAFFLKEYTQSPFPIQTPTNWMEAFMLLIEYLKTQDLDKKKVVFLDELSWLASGDASFLRALSFFWNSWAVDKNIVVVICASAASWMVDKVVEHRGGLHNRITRRIFVQPFTLSETKAFFEAQQFNFTHLELVELYMVLGGIPHYLKDVKGHWSVAQNIDKLAFSNLGMLKDEFSRLYFSLFDHAEKHIAVIRALANSHQGLTRPQIIKKSGLTENGNTSKVLKELEQSGFITSYFPFGKKKKGMLFRLTDEYSLFYLNFIEGSKRVGKGAWAQFSQSQHYKIWRGYTYENICLKHLPQLKKAMSIAGVYAEASSFYEKGTKEKRGAQIDLLLDRSDQVINVFEVKFKPQEWALTKKEADNLEQKMQVFRTATKTRKRLSLVLITTFGLKQNQYSRGLVEQTLVLDDLFQT